MEENNNLMIIWTIAPLGRKIQVINAKGKIKEVNLNSVQGEQEFLATLDEFQNQGWELVNTSTLGSLPAFTIRAFLRKRTA